MANDETILLTGGTGYVGGRLIPLLEATGRPLRCMARRVEFLRARVAPNTEVVQGDVLEPGSLDAALERVHTAYYLIHSMGADSDFEDEDRRAAANFAAAAKRAGVKRIVYLGGLGDSQESLSKHLRSRQEVGRLLAQSGAQVVEFRASIIIGSGSLSFELIRSLSQKLPVMICPQWVSTIAQPIAIEDVLAYLAAVLDQPLGQSRVYEIGGPDRVSYKQLMREYMRQRGLKRIMVSVPMLSPRLSSLWLGLVTPVFARVGRKLVDSLRNPTIVTETSAHDDFDIKPRCVSEAIGRALANEDREFAETRWNDALSSAGRPRQWGGQKFGTRLVDSRTEEVSVSPAAAFAPIQRIGGKTGWYYANFLWQIRGFIDLLIGGVGMRRCRPDPDSIGVGDTLDCWRVEAFEPNHLLRLSADMKLPGRAWLEFEVTESKGGATIRQTAIFDPIGLSGLAYWYAIWPLHRAVFAGMLKNTARAALANVMVSPVN